MINLDLSGKRAMVCGSTQGIGKSTAIELAEMGATVTLVSRNEDKLKEVSQTAVDELQYSHAQYFSSLIVITRK